MKVKFEQYKKTALQDMTPWKKGMTGIDIPTGVTPKEGDMVAKTGDDTWLITKEFFDENYQIAEPIRTKSLHNTTSNSARKNVKDIVFWGDGDTFKFISKASSESEGWMKSTKAMMAGAGVVVQVTTQQRNPDGSYSVAEALTYVPNVQIHEVLKEGKVVSRYLAR